MFWESVILIVLLFFSALFSASETALLSLDTIKIRRMQKEGKDTSYITKLLSNPSRFLSMILIGNMLVNTAISTLIAGILIKIFGNKGLALAIGIATFLLLIFGELVPKTIGIKQPETFGIYLARPLEIFAEIIHPFLMISTKFSNFFIKSLGIELDKDAPFTEDELKSIIEMSHRQGIVKENEKEMIRSVLELTRTTAQEIMTPRPDISAISESATQTEVVEYLKKTKHSKIPVYKDSLDNITGILYARDLFLFPDRDFKTIIRPALFVPATIKINQLLKDFEINNSKIAIVIDEYGNTYGLVSFEDILEEIVGEIYDEFETPEEFIQKLDEGVYRISGKTPIYLVEEKLHFEIPKGDYDTIAGYLLSLLNKIPREGESIQKGNFSFQVEKLLGKRIKSIILKKYDK